MGSGKFTNGSVHLNARRIQAISRTVLDYGVNNHHESTINAFQAIGRRIPIQGPLRKAFLTMAGSIHQLPENFQAAVKTAAFNMLCHENNVTFSSCPNRKRPTLT